MTGAKAEICPKNWQRVILAIALKLFNARHGLVEQLGERVIVDRLGRFHPEFELVPKPAQIALPTNSAQQVFGHSAGSLTPAKKNAKIFCFQIFGAAHVDARRTAMLTLTRPNV